MGAAAEWCQASDCGPPPAASLRTAAGTPHAQSRAIQYGMHQRAAMTMTPAAAAEENNEGKTTMAVTVEMVRQLREGNRRRRDGVQAGTYRNRWEYGGCQEAAGSRGTGRRQQAGPTRDQRRAGCRLCTPG